MAIIATTLLPQFKIKLINSFKNTTLKLQKNRVKNVLLNTAKEFIDAKNIIHKTTDQKEVEGYFELSTASENSEMCTDNNINNEVQVVPYGFKLQFLQYLKNPSNDLGIFKKKKCLLNTIAFCRLP